jgi:hypothetical protein
VAKRLQLSAVCNYYGFLGVVVVVGGVTTVPAPAPPAAAPPLAAAPAAAWLCRVAMLAAFWD